jgi:hypothetical protein
LILESKEQQLKHFTKPRLPNCAKCKNKGAYKVEGWRWVKCDCGRHYRSDIALKMAKQSTLIRRMEEGW